MTISIYNAVFAYSYSILQQSYLETLLEAFYFGMSPPYYPLISIAHGIMSALHGICVLLMVGGSIWQRSLVFTPWSSRTARNKLKKSPNRTVSQKILAQISDRHGICGVNGKYFHEIQLYREIVETTLQTVQAYRMSKFLPRTLLNRFYVILLAFNCWSSVFVNLCFKGNEARKRFASIVLDCVLDLVASMGVQVIVVMSYSSDFDLNLNIFSYLTLFNNEWMARAYNEFQMVVVVSWWDLASRVVFSFGLFVSTTNMKELLECLPSNRNQVAQFDYSAVPVENTKKPPLSPTVDLIKETLPKRLKHKILQVVNLFFGFWGALVLALHIHSSAQPTLPQCLMQVRPWAASRPSCYLVGLDCNTLGISGSLNEVDKIWSEFDSSTVVQLLIRHCPALEVPDRFNTFHRVRWIKAYNTTIKDWGESAAITNSNHPDITSLFMIRVNMTDGLLPVGFQSTDFPSLLYDVDFTVTNLRELPDDLDLKWHLGSTVQIEYSQLKTVPPVIIRLQPFYLALTGNPLTELPPGIFEVDGMFLLGISHMNIRELPQNVSKPSQTLLWTFMRDTNISFFWAWADILVERMVSQGQTAPWIAGYSTYCTDLAKIQNGTADGFEVPLLPEYSQSLMNSSKENLQTISRAANCKPTTGLPSGEGIFYPLVYEDSINAISIPPPVPRMV
ncbi:hypothetical protein P3T76_013695 [Phytophthora citrophthora]|uniref:Uncharacterized protein n=1 Tax=Phytophthora citrophthora TaxID=4793 RepID=A0AAD9G2K9_9STRA|nr:hypothetical protein P3T76_013695 [Phytophthora citrophthora]